jgi:hypothetical protein
MMTARLMQFSISRTLPGHWHRLDRRQRVRREVQRGARLPGAELVLEMMRQQGRVAFALAQRRDRHHDLGQAVIQVLAEAALRAQFLQLLVGRADDAHVDRDLLVAADALDHALLQEAQQLGLQRHRQVADFVEEEGAAVRQLDLALGLLGGAGEGALLVAEQFALEQVFRESPRS